MIDEDEASLVTAELTGAAHEGTFGTMPEDCKQHLLEQLSLSSLGVASCVCKQWAHALSGQGAWQRQALEHGFVWGQEDERRANGSWKAFVRSERDLARRWAAAGPLPRALHSGHRHWVPSVLMQEKTHELVTCSYDGTIRFWTSVESESPPTCFKRLVGVRPAQLSTSAPRHFPDAPRARAH